MKVVNLLPSAPKKSSASKPAKSKSVKKAKGIVTGTLKVCSDIVPYVGNLSPIGNTILDFSCCEVSFRQEVCHGQAQASIAKTTFRWSSL